MSLNLKVPQPATEIACDWAGITDLLSAKAALRGTITLLNFETLEETLNLDRIDLLAESIVRGTRRIEELT